MPKYSHKLCVIASGDLHREPEALSGPHPEWAAVCWKALLVDVPALGTGFLKPMSPGFVSHGNGRARGWLHKDERYADACVTEQNQCDIGNVMVWNTNSWQEWTCRAE